MAVHSQLRSQSERFKAGRSQSEETPAADPQPSAVRNRLFAVKEGHDGNQSERHGKAPANGPTWLHCDWGPGGKQRIVEDDIDLPLEKRE